MLRAPRTAMSKGFTLVELLIVLAVAALLITLAAPSLRDMILVQRLKAVNAQLVTDLQFARSEAVARSHSGWLEFRSNDAMTCYTIYSTPPTPNDGARCDCRLGEAACVAPHRAIRVVQLPRSDKVTVAKRSGMNLEDRVGFDHVAGALITIPPSDANLNPPTTYVIEVGVDASRKLRTTVDMSGRPTVCAPANATLGAPSC